MLITAAAIGVLAAYHFGTRAGVICAGVTAVLLVAAIAMPGYALHIYAAVGLGVVGICTVGPRVARDEARPVKRAIKVAIRATRTLIKRLRSSLK